VGGDALGSGLGAMRAIDATARRQSTSGQTPDLLHLSQAVGTALCLR
jgi:hypothetical protein